jgi:glycosyltransferase involved in cell wall biosynthesis
MNNCKKILQISTADHGGGAERIAYDLHRSSVASGYDSQMLVGYKRGNDPRVTGLVPEKGLRRFCYRCARYVERHSGVQTRFYWMAGSWLRQNIDSWDVIHLHNVHGEYFNLGLLPLLAKQSRIILTLHDCWYFTGHCAVVFDCEKWMDSCHPCCDIERYPGMERDAASYNLRRKKQIFLKSRPVLITPSQWMCDLVQKSEVFCGFDCRVIYNGIDIKRFRPGEKLTVRSRLGLPIDKYIVLYVSHGGLNSTMYKDPDLLLAAVERLLAGPLADRFHLVVVGGTKKISNIFDNCVSQVGDTRDGLEAYYQAADILVHPTKADNCPLVAMEAMSCGLPVVTASIGGVPEVVEHGVTGYVTTPGDVREFSEAIEGLLSSKSLLTSMGLASVERTQLRFSLDRMTRSYFDLYLENHEHINSSNDKRISL